MKYTIKAVPPNVKAILRSFAPRVAVVTMGCLTASCAMVQTRTAAEGEPNDSRAYAGLHYSLPKGIIDIQGVIGSGDSLYTITMSRHNDADRHARYRLIVGKNILFEDKNVFSVDEKGLLTDTLTANSVAKTGVIIDNLADTAINIGKIMLKAPGAGFGLPGQKAVPLRPFKVSFDPFCASDVKSAVGQMAAAGFQLTLDPSRDRSAKSSISTLRGEEQVDGEKFSKMGFYYRPLTTVKMRIVCIGDAAISVVKNVSVPDPSALAVYSVSRGAFADRSHTITIVEGEPRKMEHNYPSEVVAITAIPFNLTSKLLNALNGAPGLANFIWKPKPAPLAPNADIKAKEDRLKAEEDRLKAEQNYLDQKKKTEDLRRQIEQGGGGVSDTTPAGGFFLQPPDDPSEVAALRRKLLELQNERSLPQGGLPPAEAPAPVMTPDSGVLPDNGLPPVPPQPGDKH
ncbi:MAG: hypothetical protein ABI600_02130 [Luteolibacter sp.]